jgi:hypothetical protein
VVSIRCRFAVVLLQRTQCEKIISGMNAARRLSSWRSLGFMDEVNFDKPKVGHIDIEFHDPIAEARLRA